jgi:uncharacterized protein YlxP (DUF503 family)
MITGILSAKLFINNARSLKDKRQVLKSLEERLRHKFNISIAEVDDQDKWQIASIGVATVANDNKFICKTLDEIVNYIRLDPNAELIDYEQEVLSASADEHGR